MQDKLKDTHEKLKGISDYIEGIIKAVTGTTNVVNANTVTPVVPPVANSAPVANVVVNSDPIPAPVPVANTVVPPTPKPYPHHDRDHDGIEDQTPEQIAKYLDDAFDDIRKIFS